MKIKVLISNLLNLRLYRKGYIEHLEKSNKQAEKTISDKNAKIEELTLKIYLQVLEIKELNAEREALIYNQRDNHGCLIRNKK